MYEQVGGTWPPLVQVVTKTGSAILYISNSNARDYVYNALHSRIIRDKKFPDTLTVDRYYDGDKYFEGRTDIQCAYLITLKPYENNLEAKRLLSKEY